MAGNLYLAAKQQQTVQWLKWPTP